MAFGLVATSLAPLVLAIENDLELSHAAMGSVMGAWQLVYIFSAVPCGALLDHIGARRALTIGALIIALSALGRGFADGYVALLLGVMLFGLGGPIISVGAPKVVTQFFAGSDRGFAMGIYMTGPAIGGVVSLTMTHSTLLPAFDGDWRAVLYLWGAFGMLSALIWWLVSRPLRTDAQTPRIAAVARPAQRRYLGTLLREPAVQLVLMMSVGVFLINHGLNNWLPELLRLGGMSIIEAGYWASIPTVIGIFGSLLIPRLATPERRYHILVALCLAAALATLLLQYTHPGTMFTGLLLQGIARSSLMTVLVLTLVELPAIGERHAGTASGLFFSAAEVGGVLGPLGLGLMLDLTGGFSAGLVVLTLIALALAISAWYIRTLVARSTSLE
jgi:cyanate permease